MRLDTSRLQVSNKVLDRLNELSKFYNEPRSSLIEKAVCHLEAFQGLVEAFEKSNAPAAPAASAKPVSATGKKALLKVANDYVDRWTFDTDSPRNPTQEEIDAMLNAYDYDAPRAGYAAFAEARATLGLPHITYEALIEQWRAYLTR